ncbi:AGE family epimerase/isomerase [Marinimicrobium koreense]|uniref:AGE family epimerase/isomerase n=1 Tax=Marinimicrobium koreense TaxID=306545 RepID=UPI003F6FBC40
MSSEITDLGNCFESWLSRDALPKWLDCGINESNGAHYECLTMTGQVDYQSDVRVRVQARQAFCYAMATKNKWASAEREARGLLSFSESSASRLTLGGGFSHRLNSTFSPSDTEEDLYDQAFFLLSYAMCIKAFGDDGFSAKAEEISGFLDRSLSSEFGGWVEGGGRRHRYRRQNPHMHLFEAFMSLYEATNNDFWINRAKSIFELFTSYFYCSTHEVVFEFFNEDWTLAHCLHEAPVEPGHMMEWVWLLDWYSRLSETNVDHLVKPLFRRGLVIGLSAGGLVYDEVNYLGEIHKSSMRSWGLTELIKAALVMHQRKEAGALTVAEAALDRLLRTYLKAPFPGGYIDQVDEEGNPLSDRCPASTLYHYCVLAHELKRHVLSANPA